ncbi:iron-sulfur cluster assembly accessory protein [archaeon]|nr:iron-sulfur cluster assembly accessory protein [archaeon]
MAQMIITRQTTIGELIGNYPEAASLMLEAGLHCVGCHVSPNETIGAGCDGHGMPDEETNTLLTKLNQFCAELESKRPNTPVSVSIPAANRIRELMEKQGKSDHALRVLALPGGCAGYTYSMKFEAPSGITSSDIVFESNGVRIALDQGAAQMLHGCSVEWQESLEGSKFVFNNPGAKSTCGCGKSFH